jgi:hypothetical protein
LVCAFDLLTAGCSWVSVRIDALGGLFAAGLGTYLVYGPPNETSALNTGFALTMAGKPTLFLSAQTVRLSLSQVGFSGVIISFVRILNMFEVEANA